MSESREREVAGIVLAAGEARRMGGALKQLLPWRGRPVLAHVIDVVRAVVPGEVVVVLGCRADEVRVAIDARSARAVVNPWWEQGMLSSLKAGIRALATGVAGALVTVADLPTLAPATCRAVLAAWQADPERIVAPVHAGCRGHPVLFPRSLFDDILAAEHADGPRGVLRSHPGRLLEVAVDDAGCIADMDTPADYRKICEVQR